MLGLFAQVADVHLQHVVVAAKVVTPHLLQDLVALEDLAGVAHQVVEEVELGRCEVKLPVAPPRLAGHGIEREIGVSKRLLLVGSLRAPEQGMNSRQQFGGGKGFDQVVVGPALQSLDAILDGVTGGQHQDHCPVVCRTEAFRHLDAVQPGHEPVEHDDVRVTCLHLRQRLAPVGGSYDVKALVGQRAVQHLEQFSIIVHDEYSHHRHTPLDIIAYHRHNA